MAALSRGHRLKKELGVVGAYSLATGATLSAGFFLLPGLAAQEAGAGAVISYMLAVLPLIPATFSIVELSTAMPRAGGAYYFLDRSLGPLMGTIGGTGTWLVLVLKTAFALIGMGAYLRIFLGDLPIVPVAIGLAALFGGLNLLGAEKTAFLQVGLVGGLLAILTWFIGAGLPRVEWSQFAHIWDPGFDTIFGTAGMVYISYVGVTKVASVSEEIRRPERSLPLAVFSSLATVVVVFALGTIVMVGVLGADRLAGDLTPVASAATVLAGRGGALVVSLAALLAFSSVANAGILSASRYPLAMSRDRLLPDSVRTLSRNQIPYRCVIGTVAAIVAVLVALDPVKIAKLASAFQLVMFALLCVAVIVMRESRIHSYDPGFRSPLYPYMQIAGVVLPLLFLRDMGWLSILFSLALLLFGVWWYYRYGRHRVERRGAIYHVFHRLGHERFIGLDAELRTILREKGVRREDPFDEVVANAHFLDVATGTSFQKVTQDAARVLAGAVPESADEIARRFLEGTSLGATPVAKGGALPHFRHDAIDGPLMVLARSVAGIHVEPDDPLWGGHAPDHAIHAIFFLVSPEDDPAMHLRILAQVAERMDDDGFMGRWQGASNEQRVKEILLQDERYLAFTIRADDPTASLVGRALREVDLAGCLVALIQRDGEPLIPRGDTELAAGDRLTILGEASHVAVLRDRYRKG